MPITLTTSISTGDIDTSNYDTVKITTVNIDVLTSRLGFGTKKGYMDSGNFVPGKIDAEWFDVPDDDLTAMKAVEATTDETWWDHNARVLYQWLLDEGHYVGSIT